MRDPLRFDHAIHHDAAADTVAVALCNNVAHDGRRGCHNLQRPRQAGAIDVLGVSILSGAHMTIFPKILKLLEERKASDIIVVGGGVMPDDEAAELKNMGVKEILLQDTPPETIVSTIRRLVAERGLK